MKISFLKSYEIKEVFSKLSRDAKQLDIGVAYLRDDVFDSIKTPIKSILSKGKVRLVVGTYSVTESKALMKLLSLRKLGAIKLRYFHNPKYHPKLYIFKGENEVSIILGSSNLTGAGFTTNVEANLLVRADTTHPIVKSILQFYEDEIWTPCVNNVINLAIVKKIQKSEKRKEKQDRETEDIFPKIPMTNISYDRSKNVFTKRVVKPPIAADIKAIYRRKRDNERIKIRMQNEEAARTLLDKKAGSLTIGEIKKLLDHLGEDFSGRHNYSDRFGQLTLGQNRRLILQSNLKGLNELIYRVYKQGRYYDVEKIKSKYQLKGISDGIFSALLYLRNPNKHNIYIPKPEAGVRNAFGITKRLEGSFQQRYDEFNDLANSIKMEYTIEPQMMDIVLTVLGK